MKRFPSWVNLIVAIIIAGVTFYMSSLTGEQTSSLGPSFPLKPLLYHFGIFFLLSFFLGAYFLSIRNSIRFLLLNFFICGVYALSDEIHQLFVVGRTFSYFDIFIDVIGVLFANLVLHVGNRLGR